MSLKAKEWLELGTFGSSVRVFQEELERKCSIAQKTAENLKSQVFEPLQDFVNYQTTNRKFHKQNLEKSLKGKSQAELAFYKSKDKYFQKQKELLALKGGYILLNAKDAAKREAKIEKLTKEIQNLDSDYQHNGIMVNDSWKTWEKTMTAGCKEAEKMDRDRLGFLREKIWIFTNIFSESFVEQDEGCENIRSSLEKCNFDKDIQDFLKQNGAESSIKDAPVYVPFSVETADQYDTITGKAQRKNSFLSMLGIGNLSIAGANSAKSPENGAFIVSDSLKNEPSKDEPSLQPQIPTHYSLSRPNKNDDKDPRNKEIPEIPSQHYDIYDFTRVKKILFHVHVLFNYMATAPEELTICPGQLLAVFNTHDDGWWEAVGFGLDGRERIGLFPSNFCEKVQLETNPPVEHIHKD